MRIHLIHGIRTGPDSPVKGLIPYLADFDVRYVDYGYEYAFETRFINPMLVGTLLPYIEPGDICIGHSNGCAIIYELMSLGAPMQGAVFINGALKQELVRPSHVKFIRVYYNAGDEVTEVAKIGAALGVVDQDWGPLGHAGYNGTDPKIPNVDCGATSAMPPISGHSDFFNRLGQWGPFLHDHLVADMA